MKLTVVGYWGGYPGVNEATSGYLLRHEGFNLLIDCGSGVLGQLQNYIKLEELSAVILSHYHHDHVADIGPLQYARLVGKFLGKTGVELPIYAHTSDSEGFTSLSYKGVTKGIAYQPSLPIHIGPFEISFLKTQHPAVCYAMRITTIKGTIVFTADSSYIEDFVAFSENADLLLCECNLYAGQDGSNMGHMNSHDAATIASKANVKELILTHLPHFGDHQQLVKEASTIYNGKIDLAKSGLIREW
ncbi:MBL fold metallo-hydrolase [Bacillus timonensis]|nr:MBL fold metallo-hydrolase [Bacillus timonensis]